jgi:hypothetical protein
MFLKQWISVAAIGVALASIRAAAQDTLSADVAPTTSTNSVPNLDAAPLEKAWSFSISTFVYSIPDSRDYVQPTFTADHDWLHLEARYQYEAHNTGSAWIGYNLGFGDKVSLELTPMFGAVFGNTTGLAPGYKVTLNWWKLELYSEAEYVVDLGHTSESFFYTWSELTLSPVEWFRFGMVAQRTKLYETDFDIQRGFLVGFSFKHVDLSAYVFNPDDDPTVVVGVTVSF